MYSFSMDPTVLLGTELPPAERVGWALPPVDTTALLRRLGVRSCIVAARWDELEPTEDRPDAPALEALRERLLRLRALGAEPVLCLYAGEDPAWFLARGGWGEEDNLRCYLRYVGRVLRGVGHLVNEYITLRDVNSYAWEGGGAGSEGRTFYRSVVVMSHMASAHIRAYRLIHDGRTRRGFQHTAVGFALRMRAPVPEKRLRLRPFAMLEPIYQLLPLRAMARGEFVPPLKNVLRVAPGAFCDFVGLCYGAAGDRRGAKADEPRDDGGRSLRPESLTECCAAILRTANAPVYVLEQGINDWEDAFRARYLYDSLRALTLSHLPVPRYYYCALLDDPRPGEGGLERRGLAYAELISGKAVLRRSGAFFAGVIRAQGVTRALYDEYAAGQEYKT